MSRPRQLLRNATYLVTRRTTQRELLLRPSALVNQVFLYCLAVAAERTGVLVHAVVVMGNHYHAVVTDVYGRVPEFYGFVHEFVAKCLNVAYDRSESLWSSAATSVVELVDGAAVLDKVAYAMVNPVAAGLVREGAEWPGLRLVGPREIAVARPRVYFREDGPMPAFATLRLTAPPLDELADSDESAAELVARAALEREAALRAELERAGRTFLGAAAVQARPVTERPASRAARRGLSPRVAGRNVARRIAALLRQRQFVSDYGAARERWCAGERDVVFPAGTYALRVFHRARVAEA